MIKLVIFDLAGTVIDEQNIVYKTLYNCIKEEKIDITFDQVLQWGAGKEKSQALRDVLRQYSIPIHIKQQESIFQKFIGELKTVYKDLDVRPMPGSELLFNRLRQKKILIGFTTGYNREIADLLLQKLNWKIRVAYDILITSSDVSRSRPFPDMIQRAMHLLGVKYSKNVIKVGDSKADIEEGISAGCLYSIGITTGAQNRKQLEEASPDFIIDHLSEIEAIL